MNFQINQLDKGGRLGINCKLWAADKEASVDETIAAVLSEVVGIFLFKEGFSLVDKMFLLTPG